MSKRWFMSYLQESCSRSGGAYRFGSLVYEGDEHPVGKIIRWNNRESRKGEGQLTWGSFVLLSFCEVGKEVVEMDTTSGYICLGD